MSSISTFEKFKLDSQALLDKARRRFAYLIHSTDRFGSAGIPWWFKTHNQIEQLDKATDDLRLKLAEEEISFLWLEEYLLAFTLPEEDIEHICWYTDAHHKLEQFKQDVSENNQFNIKLLKLAMNELKFICQADEFHKAYGLESIQQRVKNMYQELLQKIDDQQALEKEKIETEKQDQQVEISRAEADKAEAIVRAKAIENIKIKEKKLAIIEQKKKQQAEKEVIELKIKEDEQLAETRAKEAERERQAKLQDSYRELELKETIKEMPLEELVEILHQKINNKQILTFIQLDQLAKLKQTIDEKKVD